VHGALAIKGDWLSASEIAVKVRRMRPFFEHSGGGITLSGGEVTAQVDFAAAVLAGCQADNIHTAIETCGATSWERLARLAQYTDLILYDLKLVDECAHRRWTGASNQQILDNARRLAAGNYHVQIRVPLIPGITDALDNVRGIADFMHDAGLNRIALMPYNDSASAKYEWLGRPYEIVPEPRDDEYLQTLLDVACSSGLSAVIG
jgi:pyruvate formate lyase activating enzyme